MPDGDLKQLKDMCYDTLGAARVRLAPANANKPHVHIHNFIKGHYAPDEVLIQCCLDDDDAVSVDFVEMCRHARR